MLDRISNDINETLSQSSISRVSQLGMQNPYNTSEKSLFIDESNISDRAIELYERELDVKRFTQMVLDDVDDVEANSLVVSKAFDGEISIDDDEAIFSLLSNEDFLNEIAS